MGLLSLVQLGFSARLAVAPVFANTSSTLAFTGSIIVGLLGLAGLIIQALRTSSTAEKVNETDAAQKRIDAAQTALGELVDRLQARLEFERVEHKKDIEDLKADHERDMAALREELERCKAACLRLREEIRGEDK